MSLQVLGSINRDIVTSVAHLPRPGETVSSLKLQHYPGGKGSNQAIAAARLGADVSLLGATGSDEHGVFMREYLRDAGVNIEAVVAKEGVATGQAFICVSEGGENSIVVVPGANHAYLATDLPTTLGQGGIYLTQFEMSIDAIRAFLTAAECNGGIRAINAAPAIPEGEALFPLADYIIVNEVELVAYAGATSDTGSSEELAEQARSLMTRDDQYVIVTIGAKGTLAISADAWYRVESQPATVVDTTGAGDCFCGALMAALDRGEPLREAITYANTAAAIAVSRHGAASSMPTPEDMPIPTGQ